MDKFILKRKRPLLEANEEGPAVSLAVQNEGPVVTAAENEHQKEDSPAAALAVLNEDPQNKDNDAGTSVPPLKTLQRKKNCFSAKWLQEFKWPKW